MRKMSETILDFGEPVLSMWQRAFNEPPPIDVMKHALLFVLTVWNAHVMATKIWGKPQYLTMLHKQFADSPSHREMVELLSRRWHERFSDDARAVGNWDIVPDGGDGHKFQCDARWPGTPGTA